MDFSQSPITILLIAANAIFSFIGFSNQTLVNKTILWPYYIKRQNQYYRFISSGFLHADWMHLIFNMFTLYFFGKNIEAILSTGKLGGSLSYLLLYFGGMIVASLPSYFRHKDDYNYRGLGASGAVSAVVFAMLLFAPWGRVYIYGAFGISFALYAVLYLFYCVSMDKRNADNVNHNAHLWGSIFGLAFSLVLVGILRSDIYPYIVTDLKNFSLMGKDEAGAVLRYIFR